MLRLGRLDERERISMTGWNSGVVYNASRLPRMLLRRTMAVLKALLSKEGGMDGVMG